MKSLSVAVGALLMALSLAACSASPSPVSANGPEGPTAGPSPACSLSCASTPQTTMSGPPTAAWDRTSEAAARDTATAVIKLFARPNIPADRWYADLEPKLAPGQYRTEAQYIDPANVPIRRITGALTVKATNPYTAAVTVPTDAGSWSVSLHRLSQTAPWLVTNISSNR